MTGEKSTRTASIWAAIEQISVQLVQFTISLVLARLLVPEDFGLVALVLFFSMAGVSIFQRGLQTALIRERASTIEEESAIFWFVLVTAILFGSLLVLAGPWIGAFFDQPILAPLMWAAAAQLTGAALAMVPMALLNRSLALHKITIAAIAGNFVSGTAGIYTALQGAGPWAIATHLVLFQFVNAGMLWLLSGWRPQPRFRWQAMSGHVRFGSYLSVSNIFELVYNHGIAVIIGKLYGFASVGLYNRAQGTQQLPGNLISEAISRVSLPTFSSKTDDPGALVGTMRLTNRIGMTLNMPAMIFIALFAEQILFVLFGEQWVRAAPILSILAFAGLFRPLHTANIQLLLAQGDSRRYLAIETLKKGIGIPLVIIGSLAGIVGLAISQVIFNFIAFLINARASGRQLGYGPFEQLRDLAPCAVIAILTAAGGLAVAKIAIGGPYAQLALVCFGAGLSHLLSCWLLRAHILPPAKAESRDD